jgi:hypothetical protein
MLARGRPHWGLPRLLPAVTGLHAVCHVAAEGIEAKARSLITFARRAPHSLIWVRGDCWVRGATCTYRVPAGTRYVAI